jgi:biopolymer transport protein ExbD
LNGNGQFQFARQHQMPTAEINMTPLVDVMLVLLIIFIITAPLMTHSVQGRPAARRQHADAGKADDAAGVDHRREPDLCRQLTRLTAAFLEQKFREAVAKDANVEMHLKADRSTRYESVAETMSAARRAGLTKDRLRHPAGQRRTVKNHSVIPAQARIHVQGSAGFPPARE